MNSYRSPCTLLFTAVVLAAIAAGGKAQAKSRSSSPYAKLEIFARVLSLIEKNHVNKIDGDKLIEGSLEGMLRVLDPHSAYLSTEEYKMLQEDTEGNFCGVGMEVSIKDGILTVIAPMPDSPAIKAGIRTGDIIIEIEGIPTLDMDIEKSVELMRGPEDTDVTIKIVRQGVVDPIEVTLTRTRIDIVSVETSFPGDGVAAIKIKTFSDDTSWHVREAIKEATKKYDSLTGIILDMRGNPGGLMYEAILVSDIFLRAGNIMSMKGRDGELLEEFSAHRRRSFSELPLVVLIDGGSASASEIVAGALKDNGRATLVGTTSFGKGSVQTIIPLNDGSALKLTTALYYTPSGINIHDKGIEPHVVVEQHDTQSPEQYPSDDSAQDHSQKTGTSGHNATADGKVGEKVDNQMTRALEILAGLARAKQKED